MNYISENWEKYFETFNEGMGTTYERFVIHGLFSRIAGELAIHSVIESPSFGMTGVSGINSMWWAEHGVRVNVVDDNPERLELARGVWSKMPFYGMADFTLSSAERLPCQTGSFELGWNFAALGLVENPAACLDELSRVCSRALFICIPNQSNVFSRLRSCREGISPADTGRTPDVIIERLADRGWRLVDDGYFDVPPWPDIAMAKEDMLRRIGLGWMASRMESGEGNKICIIDHFSGKNKSMEKDILRLGFLENSPRFFKKIWAHHRYLFFRRM